MNLLLDTHIALWALTGSPRLTAVARGLILDAANDVWFSAATIWEIAIKHSLAREDMPVSGLEASKLFLEAGYIELPVTAAHAAATEELPPHHADPFDRILVAQSVVESMRLLTHDRQLLRYGAAVQLL
jgi:PIN domain nuclease of toxin-antitoxin system